MARRRAITWPRSSRSAVTRNSGSSISICAPVLRQHPYTQQLMAVVPVPDPRKPPERLPRSSSTRLTNPAALRNRFCAALHLRRSGDRYLGPKKSEHQCFVFLAWAPNHVTTASASCAPQEAFVSRTKLHLGTAAR